MSTYQYKALPDADEFRILTLRATGDQSKDTIYCEISHHPMPSRTNRDFEQYEALSWTWGAETNDDVCALTILDKNQSDNKRGSTLMVKSNLFEALKVLRYPDRPRKLWVDYVCINQSNHQEKNLQVQMMFSIYGYAWNVCIWLGNVDGHGDTALDFIKTKVCDFNRYAEITAPERSRDIDEGWHALAALLSRGWFRRRWVVQEVALAKAATVHVGWNFVNWQQFEAAVAIFDRETKKLHESYYGSKAFAYDRQLFGNVAEMGSTRLVRTKSNIFRWNSRGEIMEARYTLGELVCNLFDFEARQPHDLIYAVLSLASDTRLIITTEGGTVASSTTTAQANGSPAPEQTANNGVTPDGEAALKKPAVLKAA